MSRHSSSFILFAAIVASLVTNLSAARAPDGGGMSGWVAVDFSQAEPRVLYDVRTEGGQLLGTESSIPVQVAARLACASGGCRGGTAVDLGASIAGGAYALRAAPALIPRGNRPEPIVDAPVQLVDGGGRVLAAGMATMYFMRVGSGPSAPGPVRWWYLPVSVIYRLGDTAPSFPSVTEPPVVTGPREMSGTFTSGWAAVDVPGCCRQTLTFDVSNTDVRLTGTSTEPGSVSVQNQCPWPGCRPGTGISLESMFLATIQGSGEATVRGETLAPAYYTGGFRFTTGTVVIPAVDMEQLIVQSPFTSWGPFDVFTSGAARQGDPSALWASGTFTGAGTATLVMDRVYVTVGEDVVIAYVPRRLVYTFER